MSLSALELTDVIAELSAVLPGASFDKINEPLPNCCQLKLRKHLLWIDLRPGLARLHLSDKRKPGPERPSAWVMKLRKELSGMRLTRLEQVEGDRVLRFDFVHSHKQAMSLLIELFGRPGRMLLLNEAGRIASVLLGTAEEGKRYTPPKSGPAPQKPSRFPAPDAETLCTNHAVAAHYEEASEQLETEEIRRRILSQLKPRHKRVTRRLGKLLADRDRTLVAEDLRRQAEVLKMHLGVIRRGQTRLSLADPMSPDGAEIVVKLEPALNPVENMNRMFSRARRLTAARGGISHRLQSTRQELAEIETQQGQAANENDLEALKALAEKLKAGKSVLLLRKGRAQGPRLPYRSYVSAKGKRIMVGRSGKDNHQLTFRLARGSDLWLHARDAAGAHVIVRLARKEEIDQETLLDAATLAALGSPFKNESKVEISYTHVKNVHPIKGAAPGLVSVGRARGILVRMEPARIQRLETSKNS